MNGPELMAEFTGYAADVTDLHYQRLEGLGVPSDWCRDSMAPVRFGATRARLERDGTWTPDPAGAPVCILPEPPLVGVRDPAWPIMDLSDLIAFKPGDPTRWWFRTGNTVLLNTDAPLEAMYRDRPLVLHPDPLAWMRAAGDGAVVLDWSAFLPLHIGGAPSITCMGMDLAERLDRKLKRPPARYRIEVAEIEAAA